MSVWKIVLKSIAQRKLSSVLTAGSIALGTAVVVAVLALKAQTREGFSQSAFGYDLVVGAPGSTLQLVLNTVFHLDQSPGNVEYARYKEFAAHGGIALAIPVSVGDQYRGHRVVGTTEAFLTDFEVRPGRRFEIEGRPFRFSEDQMTHAMAGHSGDHDHGGVFEAVLGASAAHRTGLRIGDTFSASHGVVDETETHEEEWTVVGILRPTGTPNDRAIFINLDSFYGIKDHKTGAEISAILLRAKSEGSAFRIKSELDRRKDLMAAVPAQVVGDLFELIGRVDVLLLAVACLVIVVGGVSILVSIYNSMAERRRPIAIMRALGARRTTILSIVILEAAALCFFGGVAGLALGHVLTALAAGILSAEAGVSISAVAFHGEELAVFGGVLVLGVLAGALPALKAYRTDIADGLNPSS